MSSGVAVEESRAKRIERLQSKFRDRGGIFVPSEHNALLDVLLARGVNGESPSKRRMSRKSLNAAVISTTSPLTERRQHDVEDELPITAQSPEDHIEGSPLRPPAGTKARRRQSTKPAKEVKAKANTRRKSVVGETQLTARGPLAIEGEPAAVTKAKPRKSAPGGKIVGSLAKSKAKTTRKSMTSKKKASAEAPVIEEECEPVAGPSRPRKPQANKSQERNNIQESVIAGRELADTPVQPATKRVIKKRATQVNEEALEEDNADSVRMEIMAHKRSFAAPGDSDQENDHEPPQKKRLKTGSSRSKSAAPSRETHVEAAEESENDIPLALVVEAKRKRKAPLVRRLVASLQSKSTYSNKSRTSGPAAKRTASADDSQSDKQAAAGNKRAESRRTKRQASIMLDSDAKLEHEHPAEKKKGSSKKSEIQSRKPLDSDQKERSADDIQEDDEPEDAPRKRARTLKSTGNTVLVDMPIQQQQTEAEPKDSSKALASGNSKAKGKVLEDTAKRQLPSTEKENRTIRPATNTKRPTVKFKRKPKPRLSHFPRPPPEDGDEADPIDFLS
ncbi:uncharacterized protein FIBRA_08137 [Fibroporia radiculosa]|uniref:Uncharacterized protein n=1 Tax=Fibroporia radiculosa TaxID=599839 RepID=J4H505_9APHY|nr:uncharacterized protein FIBRA_08137 [Fibroporia radiculosa]CCM05899.1 predicted protein [Fibroporia radiculosa]